MLWHLLLFMFNYDYTLEEGGVESSAETNQQVSLDVLHPVLKLNLVSFYYTCSVVSFMCSHVTAWTYGLHSAGKNCLAGQLTE